MTEAEIREIVRTELIRACWTGEIRVRIDSGISYMIKPVDSPFFIVMERGGTGPEVILAHNYRRRARLVVRLCRLLGL